MDILEYMDWVEEACDKVWEDMTWERFIRLRRNYECHITD